MHFNLGPVLFYWCQWLSSFHFSLKVSISAIRSNCDEVSQQGIEFWSSVCDQEIYLQVISKLWSDINLVLWVVLSWIIDPVSLFLQLPWQLFFIISQFRIKFMVPPLQICPYLRKAMKYLLEGLKGKTVSKGQSAIMLVVVGSSGITMSCFVNFTTPPWTFHFDVM